MSSNIPFVFTTEITSKGAVALRKKIVKVWMMEARAKRQSVVILVVSVAKMVDCVSPVKGAVALDNKSL